MTTDIFGHVKFHGPHQNLLGLHKPREDLDIREIHVYTHKDMECLVIVVPLRTRQARCQAGRCWSCRDKAAVKAQQDPKEQSVWK